MEAPFDKKLKDFLRSVKDPKKKKAIQLLFLSNREYTDLSEGVIRIHSVNNEEKTKLAS